MSKESKKVVVIHHSADADGWFSREIARKFFGSAAEYIGWDYGDPVPAVSIDAELYMIDISVDGLMHHPRLVWIDHHKSAILKYPASIPGLRVDGVAACRLAWQFFFGAMPTWVKQDYFDRLVEEPLAVTLAGEYDVFDHRDPRALLFNDGLYLVDREKGVAELLTGDTVFGALAVTRICDDGRIIGRYRAQENKSVITKQGLTVRWEGLTFIACNSARYNSFLFTAGITPEHDACLGFRWNGRKRKWQVSLYGVPGKPDVDLSVIASKHGGGGHKQACGFECRQLPFSLEGPASE